MTYDAGRDFTQSYFLACHLLALQHGARRFTSLWELYYLESKGLIP
jgi:hypothetical protein